jgi:hypothetical protein
MDETSNGPREVIKFLMFDADGEPYWVPFDLCSGVDMGRSGEDQTVEAVLYQPAGQPPRLEIVSTKFEPEPTRTWRDRPPLL